MKKITRIVALLMLVLFVANASAATLLSHGSTGLKVRMLQRKLIELGYLAGDPTNTFDDATLNAVKAFQTDKGLVVDGVVGYATLNKLGLKLEGVNKIEVGQQNEYILALQKKLASLGYYKNKLDGKYGPSTIAAVMGFQRDKGLQVTGKVNSKTLALLDIGEATLPEGSNLPGNRAVIKQVQIALANLGFYSGKIDGKFGSKTLEALMNFQSARGLTVNGKLDNATLSALGVTIKPAKRIILANNLKLKLGHRGKNVTALQKELKRLGYYGGKIDGKFEQKTFLAVCRFQVNNSLRVDGIVGRATINVLNSGTAIRK